MIRKNHYLYPMSAEEEYRFNGLFERHGLTAHNLLNAGPAHMSSDLSVYGLGQFETTLQCNETEY